MQLRGQNNSVYFYNFEEACKKIGSFTSNYNQMKAISINNHAKVFDEVGKVISLWEPIKGFVENEYEKFLKTNTNL